MRLSSAYYSGGGMPGVTSVFRNPSEQKLYSSKDSRRKEATIEAKKAFSKKSNKADSMNKDMETVKLSTIHHAYRNISEIRNDTNTLTIEAKSRSIKDSG